MSVSGSFLGSRRSERLAFVKKKTRSRIATTEVIRPVCTVTGDQRVNKRLMKIIWVLTADDTVNDEVRSVKPCLVFSLSSMVGSHSTEFFKGTHPGGENEKQSIVKDDFNSQMPY